MATTVAQQSTARHGFDPAAPASPPAQAQPAAAAAGCPLTPTQMAIVKATAPVLQQHGVAITTLFYQNMLAAHPELRDIFSATSQANGRQPRALAASVLAYAQHVDDLGALKHAVARIAHKHASLHVQPDQYPIVGKHLIEAIGAVLGDAATPAIVDAWTAAYGVLADVFIGAEAALYKAHENWVGWRKFRIVRREREAEGIDSFYLAPVDGAPLPTYLPGQYVSVQAFVPALGHLQSRQYSLSEAARPDGAFYRISVKRDDGDVPGCPGLLSNLLHGSCPVGSEVELSHPQGEFFVDPADASREGVPLVLISAGVGATPLLAILGAATRAEAVRRPVAWVHASQSRARQPFAEAAARVLEAARADGREAASLVFLYDVDPATDVAGRDYDVGGGGLDLGRVADAERQLFVGDARAEYYICGPEAFMVEVRQALMDRGVARERTHLELFATGDVE